MTQKILNTTLCGLLAYFVLGLFLLGKGSFDAATTPLQWQFRIFAMAGFLVVALGLLLLCLFGKRETDRSLKVLLGNSWAWGSLGFLAVIGYGAVMTTSLILGNNAPEPGDVDGVVGTWPFWINALGAILFGGSLSILSAFTIVRQKKSSYNSVLLSVTMFVLVLCLVTFLLVKFPSNVTFGVNFLLVIAFWMIGIATTRMTFGESQNTREPDRAPALAAHPSQSDPARECGVESDTTAITGSTSENVFDIRKEGHELPAMLISSLFGVFLFGVTSNFDGNPGPFDLGSNSLFGMLTMSLVLLPIIYALRKHNLVPIFYWLIFPLIASVLIVFDTLPEDNPVSFAGSTGVYFFCTVVFLFSLALLVMFVQNSEGSPFLPIVLAEITLACACLMGVAIANLFPDENVRGPIVLILATIYFVYVLLTPILLFWQNRKSSQQPVTAEHAADESHETEKPALTYEEKIGAIAKAYGLSNREREILGLVGKGYNSPYIAAALVISENTTRTHLKNIYRKLAVGNRMDVVELVNGWTIEKPPAPQNEASSQM